VQEAAPGAVVEDECIEDTCGKPIFVAVLKLEGGKTTEVCSQRCDMFGWPCRGRCRHRDKVTEAWRLKVRSFWVQIYRTDQRNLFSKYADKRTKSIAEIKAAVAAAK